MPRQTLTENPDGSVTVDEELPGSDVSEGPPTTEGTVTKFLTREMILSAKDVVTERVEVPEWGGYVLVRGLTGRERDRFEDAITEQSGKDVKMNLRNFRAKLVVLSTYDPNGQRLFSEADVIQLGDKSAAAIQRIFRVAQRLAGMTPEDVAELTSDSTGGPNEGFGSD